MSKEQHKFRQRAKGQGYIYMLSIREDQHSGLELKKVFHFIHRRQVQWNPELELCSRLLSFAGHTDSQETSDNALSMGRRRCPTFLDFRHMQNNERGPRYLLM